MADAETLSTAANPPGHSQLLRLPWALHIRTYLGIVLIVTELQQQVLLFLTQLSDQVLLYAGVHEVPSHLSRAWQVAPD